MEEFIVSDSPIFKTSRLIGPILCLSQSASLSKCLLPHAKKTRSGLILGPILAQHWNSNQCCTMYFIDQVLLTIEALRHNELSATHFSFYWAVFCSKWLCKFNIRKCWGTLCRLRNQYMYSSQQGTGVTVVLASVLVAAVIVSVSLVCTLV